MTRILNVAEAVLYVDDLAANARFYQEVLDLPQTLSFADAVFLQTGRDSTLILFDRAQLAVRESVIPHHGSVGPGHVAFAVPAEELATWRARLMAHDVEIEHEQIWPGGAQSLYFRDPAGNSVELITADHYPRIWAGLQPPVSDE